MIENLRGEVRYMSTRMEKLEKEENTGKVNSERIQTLQHAFDTLSKTRKETQLTKQLATATQKHHLATAPQKHKTLLVFLHIGKAGGTSFDRLGAAISKQIGAEYVGNKHFDWSRIDKLKVEDKQRSVHVVTLLREPVDRSMSHMRFWKSFTWTRNLKMHNQNMSQFFLGGDKQSLLSARDIWQDGQAAVSWLTGTHIANWVGTPANEIDQREKTASNATAMLHLAAARLRDTKWFGLLDDLPRSMRLLQHSFNLASTPEMKVSNKNRKHPPTKPTLEESQAIASLMPQDIWLFNYAKLLFEARWHEFETGIFVEPEEPPIPDIISCASTRFDLWCNSGPLAKFFPPNHDAVAIPAGAPANN